MAVGPLAGSIAGVRYMWAMFLASGAISICATVPALTLHETRATAEPGSGTAGIRGTRRASSPLRRVRVSRPMVGALLCGSALGLTAGVYDICWTLLLLSRGASGLEIGVSWTLFAVPFVLAAKPSGWLADHLDRRALVLAGLGASTLLCAWYPFIASVPMLVVLGALEALGFAAAMPAVQSLLTQGSAPEEVGRIQGLFATCQTASTAVSAAAAGAAFAVVSWFPFVTVAALSLAGLAVAAVVWRSVPGRVAPGADADRIPVPVTGPVTGTVRDRPVLPEPVGLTTETA